MKNRLLPIPLMAVVLLCLTFIASAGPPNHISTVDTIKTQVNTEILLHISMTTEDPVYAWSVDLTINNKTIEYLDAVYGPFISSETGVLNYTQTMGISGDITRITLTQTKVMEVPGTSDEGEIATVYLRPLKIGTLHINISNPQAAGQIGGELFPIDMVVLTPSVEILSVENLADVNNDGRIDIFDLARVGLCYGRLLVGSCFVADVTGDGVINIFDLAYVGLNYGWSF